MRAGPIGATRIVTEPNTRHDGYATKIRRRCPDCGGMLDFESFGLMYCLSCGHEFVNQVARGGGHYLVRVPVSGKSGGGQ